MKVFSVEASFLLGDSCSTCKTILSRAVSRALQDPKKFTPRAYSFAILVRHDTSDLVQVSQIMRCPGGQQLRKRNGPERRMISTPLEVRWL